MRTLIVFLFATFLASCHHNDRDVHKEVIVNVIEYGKNNGLHAHGLTFSPVTGAKGNIEYLLHLTKGDDDAVSEAYVDELVSRSHGDLDKKATAE